MNSAVEVIIPWRGGCPHREAALEYVLRLWAEHHPDWTVTLAHVPEGPWVKAAAVNPAVAASRADLIVVADSDVWSWHTGAAVQRLGRFPWVMPHRPVYRLTRAATAEVLSGVPLETFGSHRGLTERPYCGAPAGGLFAAARATLLDIPMDPRFEGWGGEDYSLGDALTTLAGVPMRIDRPLWHLWHPPQERPSRIRGSRESVALRRRYLNASRNSKAMRALIDEVKGSLPH